jgi:hypothetical protein
MRSAGILLAVSEASVDPTVMKSPHILVSLFSLGLMMAMASAFPAIGRQDLPQSPAFYLAEQPRLVARVQAMLPGGTDIRSAAIGFDSVGDFLTAVRLSDNLNVPFSELKRRVTGPNERPLDQAIRELKPAAKADLEIRRAKIQANRDQGK